MTLSRDAQSAAHVHDHGLTVGSHQPMDAAARWHAVLVLASHARDAEELADWLGALGLHPEEGMRSTRLGPWEHAPTEADPPLVRGKARQRSTKRGALP